VRLVTHPHRSVADRCGVRAVAGADSVVNLSFVRADTTSVRERFVTTHRSV
jgi:hypothetical protein